MAGAILTTGDIAKRCQVTTMTVLNWIKAGELRAYQTPGRHYRIREEDFSAFLTRYDMPAETAARPEERRTRILVVDDEPKVVNSVLRILRRRFPDFEFAVALDGYEAGFQTGMFRPDLIILDVRMPGIDGLEVCRKIKTSTETMSTRILAITGFPEDQSAERMLASGAEDYLIKPFSADDLIQKVSSLLSVSDQHEHETTG